MMRIPLRYCVIMGRLAASDWNEWEVEIDGREEQLYKEAQRYRKCVEDVEELAPILERFYPEIEQQAIKECLLYEDDYVMEKMGYYRVDPDDINELVKDRDPHTLEFFKLIGLPDEELASWDANDIRMPRVCEFEEGFEPESPFDCGYTLSIDFGECTDIIPIKEPELREVLAELLENDPEYAEEFIDRCRIIYKGRKKLDTIVNDVKSEKGGKK